MRESPLRLPAGCAAVEAENLSAIDGGCCHRAETCVTPRYECPYHTDCPCPEDCLSLNRDRQPRHGRHGRRQTGCVGFDCMAQ